MFKKSRNQQHLERWEARRKQVQRNGLSRLRGAAQDNGSCRSDPFSPMQNKTKRWPLEQIFERIQPIILCFSFHSYTPLLSVAVDAPVRKTHGTAWPISAHYLAYRI
jgi:hypothetical protein